MIGTSAVYFMAATTPLGDSTVSSSTVLFVPQWDGLESAPNDVVCFAGSASSLGPGIQSIYGGHGTDCSAANGCGVHIHSGSGCADTAAQGGHWYDANELSVDPWATVGYEHTNAEGYGQFTSCVHTGFDVASNPDQLVGHAFIVHNEDGSRASCGLIAAAPTDYEPDTLMADTALIPGIDDSSAAMTGSVSVLTNIHEDMADAVCYVGYAMGLEENVESFLLGTGSKQCDAPNGCGAHIHSGTGCEDKEAQGGHYYDGDTIPTDPWKLESYYKTDSLGCAALYGCVITGDGASDYDSRPFIVHKTDGGRLMCGILGAPTMAPTAKPTTKKAKKAKKKKAKKPKKKKVKKPKNN